jgi:hypothetical protein
MAADDAEYLAFLDQSAMESPLNLSPATRTILTRFETWHQSGMKDRMLGDV